VNSKMSRKISSIFTIHGSYKYENSSTIIFTHNVKDRILIDKEKFLSGVILTVSKQDAPQKLTICWVTKKIWQSQRHR
jgi:hypothetical protein